MSQPAISRHLKVLEDAGVVSSFQDAQRRPRQLDAAGGLELYYEIHGEIHGAGEPLVMLHGGVDPSATFGVPLVEMAKSARVIAVHLQGHGRTKDIAVDVRQAHGSRLRPIAVRDACRFADRGVGRVRCGFSCGHSAVQDRQHLAVQAAAIGFGARAEPFENCVGDAADGGAGQTRGAIRPVRCSASVRAARASSSV